jgi:PHP family Zn ribbon phosphoesterase
MPEVNYEWVRQQMQEAKVKVGSGNAVLKLLEVWEQQPKLSANLAKEAIEVFSKLALGHALVASKESSDEVWVPLQPGQIKVGDEVRVLLNAFTDSAASIHNGRRGKVIAVRYGDVIVKSTDGKSPELNGVHYSPYKLEKLVRKA